MTYYTHNGPRRYIMQAKEGAINALAKSTGRNGFDLIPFIDSIQRRGAALHTRYENECNGFPFDDDGTLTEKYRESTERRERNLFALAEKMGFTPCPSQEIDEKKTGLFIALQTDPRGWPVILKIEGREYVIGGKW